MKATPQDMLDTLKTGEDKLAKVKEMKEEFAELKYKVSATRRKLASGRKFYFKIVYEGGEFWTDHRVREIDHVLRHYFPDAHLTSGGPRVRVYAEY